MNNPVAILLLGHTNKHGSHNVCEVLRDGVEMTRRSRFSEEQRATGGPRSASGRHIRWR